MSANFAHSNKQLSSASKLKCAMTLYFKIHLKNNTAVSTHRQVRAYSQPLQVVSSPEAFPVATEAMERVRAEYVVRVAGTLRLRKDPNPQLPTGELELVAEEVLPCTHMRSRTVRGKGFSMWFPARQPRHNPSPSTAPGGNRLFACDSSTV